jgi:hypothetical protein
MTWQGLTTLGASAEEAQQVMEELDVGKTGRISYTEFLAGAWEHSGGRMAEEAQLVLGGVFAMVFFGGVCTVPISVPNSVPVFFWGIPTCEVIIP